MDWSLRRKVVAALALPLIFATVLVGLRAVNARSQAESASQAKTRYHVLEPAIDFLAATQDLATEIVRTPSDAEAIQADRARFRTARSALQDAIGSSQLTAHQRSLLDGALGTAGPLDSSSPSANTASIAPGAVSSDVLAVVDDLNAIRSDPKLSALHDVVTAQSHLAGERMDLATADSFTNDLRIQLSADVGGERDSLDRVQADLPDVDITTQQSATSSRLTLSSYGTLQDVKNITPPVTQSYRPIYQAAVKEASAHVSRQTDTARRSALLQIALILALLLLTVLFALWISRRLLVRPIAQLRRSTIDVAEEHLPAAIERVQSGQGLGRIQSVALPNREEIGQLSRAIDGMQHRAIRLASEQASLRRQMTDMFETLSRRNTSLVNQQLNLLEQLERSEDDSARLDSLFRLDHLAARMRRNGQSLMVLAGNEGRHRNEALAAAQVIGAAISEVQDYQRVDVGQVPDQIVDPDVATDLVHIVAELVDNALGYSPPHTRVQVSGARAIDGGVLLEIEDSGLGIEAAALEKLNEDLQAGGRFGVETTRHMGLFVVGRLSQSHGIRVRLRSTASGKSGRKTAAGATGTVAAVHVPAEVLRAPDTTSAPVWRAPAAVEPTPEAGPAPAGQPAVEPAPAAQPATAVAGAEPQQQFEQTEAGLPRRRPGATGVTTQTGAASLGGSFGGSFSGAAAARPPAAGSPAGGPPSPDADRSTGEEWVSPIAGSASAPERSLGAVAFFTGTREARPATVEIPVQRHPPAADPAPAPPRVEDTPIFQSISSRWLRTDGDLPWSSEPTDRAWRAAQAATDEHSRSGGDSDSPLPGRQPGRYIVPGSIEPTGAATAPHSPQPEGAPLRDPEALRAKLSRYKQGVERARRAATGAPDQSHDDNGSRSW
ncbi:sensor histidine kinase [Flexivirga caeni]|uniref:histidine kinase n=2 Tax=Flexivirga caeni TaxID=2294115 RepID=A0A3M9MGD6_9MICO|nr:sensor histidine kinase [Flexivirga caeni]